MTMSAVASCECIAKNQLARCIERLNTEDMAFVGVGILVPHFPTLSLSLVLIRPLPRPSVRGRFRTRDQWPGDQKRTHTVRAANRIHLPTGCETQRARRDRCEPAGNSCGR